MKKTLILPATSVTFRSLILDKSWHKRWNHPQILDEVRAELAHECEGMDTTLLDARIKIDSADGLELEVAFAPEQDLAKGCSQIQIAGHPHFNLAPWRAMQHRHAKRWLALRLGLLPLVTALVLSLLLAQEEGVLTRQKASLHRLQTQEMKLEAAVALGAQS